MKNKKHLRNSLILFVVIWLLLYGVLRIVFDVPHTADLFVRLSFAGFLIAMVYFYMKTKDTMDY